MTREKPIDKLGLLLAQHSLAVAPGVLDVDRRVGVVILEHFNFDTGRCDPSAERLSGLLQISRATIFRSIERLDKADLIKRVTYGGSAHCNSYEPNFAKLAEIDSLWRECFYQSDNRRTGELASGLRHVLLDLDDPLVQDLNARQDPLPGVAVGPLERLR